MRFSVRPRHARLARSARVDLPQIRSQLVLVARACLLRIGRQYNSQQIADCEALKQLLDGSDSDKTDINLPAGCVRSFTSQARTDFTIRFTNAHAEILCDDALIELKGKLLLYAIFLSHALIVLIYDCIIALGDCALNSSLKWQKTIQKTEMASG
jgi:hypothetical protein